MKNMSETSIKTLSEAGWYPKRETDLESTINFLESKGYVVFSSALHALLEFDKIRCEFTRRNGDKDSFYIDPEQAYGDYYEKDDFAEIEMRVEEALIAIGQARNDNMMMFISESGKICGETGYLLMKFGDDIYEAMDTLCVSLPAEEIN